MLPCVCNVYSYLLFKDIEVKMYRTLNFLYGCESWSVIVREENRLKVLESRVLEENIWNSVRKSDRRPEKIE